MREMVLGFDNKIDLVNRPCRLEFWHIMENATR
jgi:hypothetical protein